MLPLYLAKCETCQKDKLQNTLYSTLKIKQTVKLVKLFEKMFNLSSVVLDNRLKTLFLFINDESLTLRVRSSQSTKRVSAGQLFQIIVAGKLSSTTAMINENNASRLLSRTMELI